MMLGLLAWPSVADKQKTSELPKMAFLEFLAEMEEVDGKLVSASDLLEINDQTDNNKGATAEEQLAILKLLQEPLAIDNTLTEKDKKLSLDDKLQLTDRTNSSKKEEDKQ